MLVEMAIEPRSRGEQKKLELAIAELAAADTSFQASIDHESGQIVLKGTSEGHLEGKTGALKRKGIALNIGAPQVAFLEHPTRRAEAEYAYKKIQGSAGQFAAVKLAVAPNEPGEGYHFESKLARDALPEEYLAGVEKGIESVLSSGVVAGFPVVDIRVKLIDAKYHTVDSSRFAFEIAGSTAFREALQQARSVLLEPIMKVEVMVPRDYAKAVIDDLRSRCGMIQPEVVSATVRIGAIVPLMSMFGYGSALRAISNGLATFRMQFDHYAPARPSPDDDPFRPAIGMRA